MRKEETNQSFVYTYYEEFKLNLNWGVKQEEELQFRTEIQWKILSKMDFSKY